MKLLQVFNQYRSRFNGEDAVVRRIDELVAKHGGQTRLLLRNSQGLETSVVRKVQAAFSGIYNWSAQREMRRVLRDDRPDIVHVHNLYPLFSPSILVACRQERVPVVMSLHNQQLTCPKSDHLHRGNVCEKCVGGKEFHCVLQNCRGNLMESMAYAARSTIARQTRVFESHVTLFAALSEFAKRRLVAAGFNEQQITVLPNMAPVAAEPTDPGRGDYFAFAGRMSEEKGIETILAAAALVPECRVRLAGDGPLLAALQAKAPPNVSFAGRLCAAEMVHFYRGARCLLHSSTCFEMCPLVISEEMMHGLPVIASDIGGREELIEPNRTGLLFQPHDAAQLAAFMRSLWHDPQRCRELGQAGYALARDRFGEELYYQKLMSIYHRAISIVGHSQLSEIGVVSR